jgi:hypothetical protein
MKKLLLLAFFVLLGLVLFNRERVFLRDPLATVWKSPKPDGTDAVKQQDVQVYINYSNDVLLMHEAQPGGYTLLVQHRNRTPGTPVQLKCIHWMACLTDADQAAILPVQPTGKYDPKVQMTDRDIAWVDPQGSLMHVQLR